MSTTGKLAVLLLLSLCFGSLAFAQGGATGAISGVVQDSSGAVIANGKVSVTSEATGEVLRQTKTETSGFFTATLLPVGTYTVEVNAAGFPVTKFPGVVVRITETTRITATLKLSTVKEVVEVQAQAEAVNTTDATTGESISSTSLNALPLATRNFQQLLDLSAGASANLNNAASLGRGDVRIDVNGGREDNNNYLIEGISASDYSFGELTYTPVPNPDSIQEFKVGTSLYDATQGRNGGGNINAIMKSGSSSFHGDLWEYFRNTDLDAEDFFLHKFVLKQNIFGGDLGGPVGPGAKLGYFYVNYQGTRQRSGDSLGTYISGAQLPAIPVVRNWAATGNCAALVSAFFPVGLPPEAKPANGSCGLDPVAYNLLNTPGTQFGPGIGGGWLIPSTTGNGLTLSTPGRYRDDQFTANWDKDFNRGRDRITERFFWSDSLVNQPFGADGLQVQTGYPAFDNNLNFPLTIPLRGRFGSVSETHSFSNALVNEFRLGINVISDALLNVSVPGTSPAALGIANLDGQPNMYRFVFPDLSIGPFPNQPQSALADSFVYLDTVSWTRGHHSFRFGGEIDRTSDRRDLAVLSNPLVEFVPGVDSKISPFQNFLMGEPSVFEAGSGAYTHDYHLPAFAAFAQDDWRVTPTLTLNLGVRLEWVGASYDSLCHLGNSVTALANPPVGQPYVWPSCIDKFGFSGVNGTLNSAGLNNEYARVPEPRIGFAYDVAGKHSLVIRAGYGIYSVREDIGGVDNLAFAPPIYPLAFPGGAYSSLGNALAPGGVPLLPQLGSLPSSFTMIPSFFQGFPVCNPTLDPGCTPGAADTTGLSGGAAFSGNADAFFAPAVLLHWVVPTTQQWNLSVQRQLGGNWVLELGYVGTKGTRLRSTFDPDQPALASPSNPVTVVCGNVAAGVPCLQPGVATGSAIQITQNSTANATARAPFLAIAPGDFEAFYPNSDSHYNGLQATVSHHFSKGLYFQSAYTYSKSIDDVSTASVAYLTRTNNQLIAAQSKGLSDFDHRQRFVTSLNYALPFYASRHDAMGLVAGGWEVDSVLVAQSGAPITIQDTFGGSDYALTTPQLTTATFAPGFGCSNAVNTGSLATKLANWVNPKAYLPDAPVPFSVDGSTGFGDSPRNCIIGPKQFNLDFTLGKAFKFGERQNLRFRAEFFNLFNHPSFQNPLNQGKADVEAANPVTGASEVGAITQTNGTPRLVQFSLKYSF
jgi:carboxypeptidase family protein/TonB-dependent receptor-like protein